MVVDCLFGFDVFVGCILDELEVFVVVCDVFIGKVDSMSVVVGDWLLYFDVCFVC